MIAAFVSHFEFEAGERLVAVTVLVRFPFERCAIFASQFVSSLFIKVLLHF